jgi:hypothetical protein
MLHVAPAPFWTLMILDRMTPVFLLLFLIFLLLQKARRSNRLLATFRDDPERAGATDTAAESCEDDILLAP